MIYRVAADAVMVLHFAFILFVAVGALLAWRWPRLVWLHVPSLAWGLATLTIGLACPLTAMEKGFRRLAGTEGYAGGFVDHYLDDVVYPEEYGSLLRALAGLAIVAGYVLLHRRTATRTAS